jgi:ATP-dependent exoDNAse (exonuclease V) alpha subunit
MTVWDDFKKAVGINPVKIGRLNEAAIKQPSSSEPRASTSADIEVTPEYQQIFDWLTAKAPIVFVTGKAGTGKTTFIRYLRENFKGNSVVVAPTGVAALNISGATIHSFFRFPPRVVTDDDVKLVRDRSLYRALQLLIIDEVSMVRAELIDAIDQFLQLNRESNEPFGGVQLVMVGDLFQLPPVLQRKEAEAIRVMGYESPYFFSAKVLKRSEMVAKELTKIYRQEDERFISALNRVRLADDVEELLPILNARHALPGEAEAVITLASTNKIADAINDNQLGKLKTPMHTFIGVASGNFALEDEKLPSPMNLSLKEGAQVMFTKNDEKKRWVNGTLGQVVELGKDVIRVKVVDGLQNETYDVQQVKWESYKYEFDDDKDRIVPVSKGSYRQYPLMLAWAVTIHKSQGKTLNKVRLNLGNGAFDYGQVYVALSRCRSIEDIYLDQPIRWSDIKCDPVIKRFYEALAKSK